jgi:hypothetical protein
VHVPKDRPVDRLRFNLRRQRTAAFATASAPRVFSYVYHINQRRTDLYLTDGDTLRRVTIATAKVETMYPSMRGHSGRARKVGAAFYVATALRLRLQVY